MTVSFIAVLGSLILFVLAGLAEIGGGYLVWQWLREDKAFWFGIAAGLIALISSARRLL